MTKLDKLVEEMIDCAKRNNCLDTCLHREFCKKIFKQGQTKQQILAELNEEVGNE